MKTFSPLSVLLLSLIGASSALAESQDHYWFYQTAVEKPVNSIYTVKHEETLDSCENAVNESRGLDNQQPDALVDCMDDQGWDYVQHPAMADGYYIIELCIFKQGKIVEAPFYTCNSAGAMPFNMSYSSSFSPEAAVNDAKDRYQRLVSGKPLP